MELSLPCLPSTSIRSIRGSFGSALFAFFLFITLVPRAANATIFTVTDTSDNFSDSGSLRYAINAAMNGDTIQFSGVTGTITLVNGTLTIFNSVTIQGPGANVLTISGGNTSSVFTITGSGPVNISGLTITGGNGSADPSNFSGVGGGIDNTLSGTVTVSNTIFSGNMGSNGGGAIYNAIHGTFTVMNSAIYGSSVGRDGGGGIYNSGTLVVQNSTLAYNSTGGTGGGILTDGGTVTVINSTIYNNGAMGGGGMYIGGNTSAVLSSTTVSNNNGGIVNDSGVSTALTATNSIVAGNTGNDGEDCSDCGTQSTNNLIGGTPNLGLCTCTGLNQTVLPLPGSPAIQAGDPTQLPAGLTTDERGFPRLTNGKLDLGAAQTNYTSVQFVQQPTNAVVGANLSPAITVEVQETNNNLPAPNNVDSVNDIPISLTFSGTGTLGGTLTQTTTGGVATFGDLTVNAVGNSDTLDTAVTVTPAGATTPIILTATSDPFNITAGALQPQTITFTPPTSVIDGAAPIVLAGTASSGLPVTFQLDSGPATLNGSTLTFTGVGTVVVEADQSGNNVYQPATPVVAQITVQPAATGSFTVSANPSTLTLGQNQSGVVTFTVTPQGGYTGSVSLGCSGLPINTTCTFAPPTVTLTGNGQAMTSQLTVRTGNTIANLDIGHTGLFMAAISWLPGLLLAGFLNLEGKKLRGRKHRLLTLLLITVSALSIMTGLTGCGSGGSSPAPAVPVGSYMVTVAATAGSASQTAAFNLIITN